MDLPPLISPDPGPAGAELTARLGRLGDRWLAGVETRPGHLALGRDPVEAQPMEPTTNTTTHRGLDAEMQADLDRLIHNLHWLEHDLPLGEAVENGPLYQLFVDCCGEDAARRPVGYYFAWVLRFLGEMSHEPTGPTPDPASLKPVEFTDNPDGSMDLRWDR